MDKQATAYLANEVKASCCQDKWLSQKRKGQPGNSQWLPGGMEQRHWQKRVPIPCCLVRLTRSSDISKFQQRKPLCQFIMCAEVWFRAFLCKSVGRQRVKLFFNLLLKNNFFHGGLTALVPSSYQEMLFLYCPSMVNGVNIRPSARMGNADMTQGDVCFKQHS